MSIKMKKNKSFLWALCAVSFFLIPNALKAQVQTAEDSLNAGLLSQQRKTIISGYGEIHYTLNTKRQTSTATVKRVVLFVGHQFSDKISVHTELEIEDALVLGGEEGGEVALEQAFLKFQLNKAGDYLVAGLFIPRLGFINENHLPNTFNGVNRPFTEQFVIPSTWREIGVGYFGNVSAVPGLSYSVSLTNGLNSAKFDNGTGIAGGRQLGSEAQGLNLAVTGSVRYYYKNFRVQASGYIGGSTALEKRVADSLFLDAGPFANPVKLAEVNVEYTNNGWNVRALASYINISNASDINRAFANNTPESLYGAYGEIAYDLWYPTHQGEKSLIVFGRYEYMDLSADLPANAVQNGINQRQYLVGGITYKPVRGVAVKVDYVQRITGEPNENLIVTPFPRQIPYYKSNGFVNLGVAYSF